MQRKCKEPNPDWRDPLDENSLDYEFEPGFRLALAVNPGLNESLYTSKYSIRPPTVFKEMLSVDYVPEKSPVPTCTNFLMVITNPERLLDPKNATQSRRRDILKKTLAYGIVSVCPITNPVEFSC